MTTRTTAVPTDALVEALANPTEDELAALDAWWRANNYLTIGQIYLQAQPAAARAAAPPSTSSRGCSATGAPAPACRSSTPTSPG